MWTKPLMKCLLPPFSPSNAFPNCSSEAEKCEMNRRGISLQQLILIVQHFFLLRSKQFVWNVRGGCHRRYGQEGRSQYKQKKPTLCYLYEDWLSGNSKGVWVSADIWRCVHARPAARVYGKLAGSDMTYHLSGESTAMFSLAFLWIHTAWPDNIREPGPTHFAREASGQQPAGFWPRYNTTFSCFVLLVMESLLPCSTFCSSGVFWYSKIDAFNGVPPNTPPFVYILTSLSLGNRWLHMSDTIMAQICLICCHWDKHALKKKPHTQQGRETGAYVSHINRVVFWKAKNCQYTFVWADFAVFPYNS